MNIAKVSFGQQELELKTIGHGGIVDGVAWLRKVLLLCVGVPVGVTDAEAPYSTYAKSVNKIETWGSDILFMGNYKQTVNSQKEHPP